MAKRNREASQVSQVAQVEHERHERLELPTLPDFVHEQPTPIPNGDELDRGVAELSTNVVDIAGASDQHLQEMIEMERLTELTRDLVGQLEERTRERDEARTSLQTISETITRLQDEVVNPLVAERDSLQQELFGKSIVITDLEHRIDHLDTLLSNLRQAKVYQFYPSQNSPGKPPRERVYVLADSLVEAAHKYESAGHSMKDVSNVSTAIEKLII